MLRKLVLALFFIGAPAGTAVAANDAGPKYDLIFAVYAYSPGMNFDVENYFYVRDDGVLQVQYGPKDKSSSSNLWILLYRYDWKTRSATLLPTPGPKQMAGTTKNEYYIVEATENLRLISDLVSPDGYELAEPRWVTAGPVTQALGNIALLALSGKVEKLQEKETMPRIARGDVSFSMKGKKSVLPTEDFHAFPLGWVMR